MVGAGEREIATSPGTQGLKDGALALPIEKVPGGNAVTVAISRDFGPDYDELIRIWIWHGGKKSGIDHAEDGGVRPDA